MKTIRESWNAEADEANNFDCLDSGEIEEFANILLMRCWEQIKTMSNHNIDQGSKIFVMETRIVELEKERDDLKKTLEDFAERDCSYDDNCPEFGSRHYRCVSCIARSALGELK